MKKYTFEYSDNSFALKLFGLNLVLFIILFVFILMLKINFFITITISMGIPVMIFCLNLKKIKKDGFAIIEDEKIEIILNGVIKKFTLNEVKNYMLIFNQNIVLNIKFKDNSKIGIVSSPFFCDIKNFELFCKEFEIELNKIKNNKNIEIQKRTLFFEKKWFLSFLIVLSFCLVILLITAIFTGVDITTSFFIAFCSIFTLWIRYFNLKR